MSLGTMILSVPARERGKGGGALVSRNNNQREKEVRGGGHLSLGTMIIK